MGGSDEQDQQRESSAASRSPSLILLLSLLPGTRNLARTSSQSPGSLCSVNLASFIAPVPRCHHFEAPHVDGTGGNSINRAGPCFPVARCALARNLQPLFGARSRFHSGKGGAFYSEWRRQRQGRFQLPPVSPQQPGCPRLQELVNRASRSSLLGREGLRAWSVFSPHGEGDLAGG